jgi:hypothetical protein
MPKKKSAPATQQIMRRTTQAGATEHTQPTVSPLHSLGNILGLQRTLGNQAVQRQMQRIQRVQIRTIDDIKQPPTPSFRPFSGTGNRLGGNDTALGDNATTDREELNRRREQQAAAAVTGLPNAPQNSSNTQPPAVPKPALKGGFGDMSSILKGNEAATQQGLASGQTMNMSDSTATITETKPAPNQTELTQPSAEPQPNAITNAPSPTLIAAYKQSIANGTSWGSDVEAGLFAEQWGVTFEILHFDEAGQFSYSITVGSGGPLFYLIHANNHYDVVILKGGRLRWISIPGNGSCLFAACFYAVMGRLPSAGELAWMRSFASLNLTDQQVTNILITLQQAHQSGEQLFGLGPELISLFEEQAQNLSPATPNVVTPDPATRRQQQLAALEKRSLSASTPGPVPQPQPVVAPIANDPSADEEQAEPLVPKGKSLYVFTDYTNKAAEHIAMLKEARAALEKALIDHAKQQQQQPPANNPIMPTTPPTSSFVPNVDPNQISQWTVVHLTTMQRKLTALAETASESDLRSQARKLISAVEKILGSTTKPADDILDSIEHDIEKLFASLKIKPGKREKTDENNNTTPDPDSDGPKQRIKIIKSTNMASATIYANEIAEVIDSMQNGGLSFGAQLQVSLNLGGGYKAHTQGRDLIKVYLDARTMGKGSVVRGIFRYRRIGNLVVVKLIAIIIEHGKSHIVVQAGDLNTSVEDADADD